ncbi:hypothetical protein L596_013954 [Steinernema carpocapsae]|uniref:Uncharacterized protein n=1 Tax=Steinernema carpocapsae TaxID=34508 RepID=A0A4U5N9Q4_STECR|nr:hypothetical protein L596_013954 [Steinernema carpocapsae]
MAADLFQNKKRVCHPNDDFVRTSSDTLNSILLTRLHRHSPWSPASLDRARRPKTAAACTSLPSRIFLPFEVSNKTKHIEDPHSRPGTPNW